MTLRYSMKKNVWLVIKCNMMLFFSYLHNSFFIFKMKEEVDQKVLGLEEKIEKLVEENNESKANVEEYKQSIDLLQKELSLMKKDKMQVQEMLKNANNIKAFLKTETSDYEQESKENDGQLLFAKSDCSECTEVGYFLLFYNNFLYKFLYKCNEKIIYLQKLNALQAEFDNHISKVCISNITILYSNIICLILF